MCPSFSCTDEGNSGTVNSKFFGNVRLRGFLTFKPKNLINITILEYRAAITLATAGCSVLDSISMVIFRGIPSKIINVVIGSITIIMAPLHIIKTWSSKSLKDKSMNPFRYFIPVLTKNNLKVSATAKSFFQNPSPNYLSSTTTVFNSALQTFNMTKIRDHIVRVFCIFPYFWVHLVSSVKPLCICLLNRPAQSSGFLGATLVQFKYKKVGVICL